MENGKILVVGYPKSGNTWLTRLVAELIGAPVKGFFDNPQSNEMAMEGLDRKSSFAVYKGHQPYNQIKGKIKDQNILYIVRDVRSVAISGANYFEFLPQSFFVKMICKIPKFRKYFKKYILSNERIKIRNMIQILDKGAKSTAWRKIPWDKHVLGYYYQGVLIVRYEDLLTRPQFECKRILSKLGIVRDEVTINKAIQKQSFEVVKKKFENDGDIVKANLLREGKNDEWKRVLTRYQKDFLGRRFSDTLKIIGYDDQ